MFALSMEACLRVCSVVDNLQFSLLVVIAVPTMQHPGGVSLLVSELSVVSHTRVVAEPVAVRSPLSVDLEGDFLWLRVMLLR